MLVRLLQAFSFFLQTPLSPYTHSASFAFCVPGQEQEEIVAAFCLLPPHPVTRRFLTCTYMFISMTNSCSKGNGEPIRGWVSGYDVFKMSNKPISKQRENKWGTTPPEMAASVYAGGDCLFQMNWEGWLVLPARHGAACEHREHGAAKNGVFLL